MTYRDIDDILYDPIDYSNTDWLSSWLEPKEEPIVTSLAENPTWLDCLSKLKEKPMRTFETGATRDDDKMKLDYEGFLSPGALKRYAQYMSAHRIQADGNLRDSDNWQKGIPLDAYMKSLFRHTIDVWHIHRGLYAVDEKGEQVDFAEALCAVIFNSFGYLHEYLKLEALEESKENCRKMIDETYSEVCGECSNSPRNCNESSKPLASPCPGHERKEN